MMEYWLPLFNLNDGIRAVDERRESTAIHEIGEKVVGTLGIVKPYFYIGGFMYLVFCIYLRMFGVKN